MTSAKRQPRPKGASRQRKVTDSETVWIVNASHTQAANFDPGGTFREIFFVGPHVNYIALHGKDFGNRELISGYDRTKVSCLQASG
jgi:hypothetical protein